MRPCDSVTMRLCGTVAVVGSSTCIHLHLTITIHLYNFFAVLIVLILVNNHMFALGKSLTSLDG